jgi:hypothetical protein
MSIERNLAHRVRPRSPSTMIQKFMVVPFLTASTGHDLHGGTHVVAGKEDAAEYGLEAIVGHRSTSNKLVAEFLFAGDLH